MQASSFFRSRPLTNPLSECSPRHLCYVFVLCTRIPPRLRPALIPGIRFPSPVPRVSFLEQTIRTFQKTRRRCPTSR